MLNSKIKILFVAAAMVFITANSLIAQDRNWTRFAPPTGEWSILAPGKLQADEEAAKEKSKQGSYTYTEFSAFFAVIYKDYSKLNFLPWKSGQFVKQRDVVVRANKGTLISDIEFVNGDIKGREVRIRMPDNRVVARESNVKLMYRVQRFRMFFVGRRLYMILAVMPENEVNAPAITDYMNSFLLK